MFIEPLENRIAPALAYLVDASDVLHQFSTAKPGTFDFGLQITGIGASEDVAGLDFRPATGELFMITKETGATDTLRLYTLNRFTAEATLIGGGAFVSGLSVSGGYGFDFNPTVDRVRVVNGNDYNTRINPNTAIQVDSDPNVVGTQPDTALDDPAGPESIGSIAYDRNFGGTTATTLYGIDFASDSLVRIGGVDGVPSPNAGLVTQIGALGVSLDSLSGGFDIATNGIAYLAASVGGVDNLYSVNLKTGAATLLGAISGDGGIRGFALAPDGGLTIKNATTATYTDVDGDLVTVKVSKGTLTDSMFRFQVAQSATGPGAHLAELYLSGAGFDGTDVTISAKKAASGDGFVDVGAISAFNTNNLGTVTIKGDLARITAGKGEPLNYAVKALNVRSMGMLGPASTGQAYADSEIFGRIGTINVTGDWGDARLNNYYGNATADTATTIKIGGNVYGNYLGQHAQLDFILGAVKTLTIGGSLIGGTLFDSASISLGYLVKSVTVKGSFVGSAAAASASLYVDNGQAYSITVGGSLLGNQGANSASIVAANDVKLTVSIGGSILGGPSFISGAISANAGEIVKATVGGSLVGPSSFDAQTFELSGTILARKIGDVLIKGDLIAGSDDSTGTQRYCGAIQSGTSIKSVTVKGSIIGSPDHPALITAPTGDPALPQNVAIGKVTVGRSVSFAAILAGHDFDLLPVEGDAGIGSVSVGGDWYASVLSAGVKSTDGIFGNSNDALANHAGDAKVARIASLVVKGAVFGSSASPSAFVAEQFGKISLSGRAYKLDPTVNDVIPLPVFGAATIREVTI